MSIPKPFLFKGPLGRRYFYKDRLDWQYEKRGEFLWTTNVKPGDLVNCCDYWNRAVEAYHNENKIIIMTHHTTISAKQFLELERARKNEEQAKNEETARVILDSFYSELSRINPWKGLTSNWYSLDGAAGPEVHAIVKKELEAEGYQDHAIRVHNPEKQLVLTREDPAGSSF